MTLSVPELIGLLVVVFTLFLALTKLLTMGLDFVTKMWKKRNTEESRAQPYTPATTPHGVPIMVGGSYQEEVSGVHHIDRDKLTVTHGELKKNCDDRHKRLTDAVARLEEKVDRSTLEMAAAREQMKIAIAVLEDRANR